MNKILKIRVLLVLASALGVVFWASHFLVDHKVTLEIRNARFEVEKAVTLEKRMKGLSGRQELCETCGMLFIFEKPERLSFHMRGMRFDLDMIWIRNNQIVEITREIPRDYAGLITPSEMADQVLEVNAGVCDQWGFSVGDKVIVK